MTMCNNKSNQKIFSRYNGNSIRSLRLKRKNLHSSKNTNNTGHPHDNNPIQEDMTDNIFIAFFATTNEGFVYIDLARKFPVTSDINNEYIMVLYHYDSNGILVEPMEN